MIRTVIFLILLAFFCLLFPLVWLVAAVGRLFNKRFYGDFVFYYLRLLMHLAVFVGGCRIIAALEAVTMEPSFGKTIRLSAKSATAITPDGEVHTCVVLSPPLSMP